MTREEFESILEEAFLEGYNNAIDEIEEILDEDYIDIEDDYEVYDEGAIKRIKEKVGNFIDDVKAAGRSIKSIQNKNSYKQFYLGPNGVRAKRARYQAAQDSDAPEEIKKKMKKEYDDAMGDYKHTTSNKWKFL